ncbi:RsfA family transcriptional regulator [Bacillus sp. MMSF_3328]|uniref:RsfA family transcriptional regulator n=1 Tax=Bacillus sp. MMSF_3328 TaxID=3047080 RepID=UPI00273F79D5|nr:RsfA family transcriptional regulator [Bacillus sp. MMSF_3328]
MNNFRKDSWSEEEDKILACQVLNHIETGGTQLQAFEKVGVQLRRTAAACGFRWNATVRKQYKEEVEVAKQIKRSGKGNNEEFIGNLEIFDIVRALYERINKTSEIESNLKVKIEQLTEENKLLSARKSILEQKYFELFSLLESVPKKKTLT